MTRTLISVDKAPFPYFGGKRDAADITWTALGDPEHYVEAFAGSLAVLLRRPHQANRPYFSETVNDADGLLCNAWRSIQLSPDKTAEAASYPVIEADVHARHLALVKWRASRQLEHLMGDPAFPDPVMAGWWIWGMSCWIGSGFCSGEGGWSADADGRLMRQSSGMVSRQLPHLGNDGQGVNHAGAREPGVKEPGVSRKRPHLVNNGQGVNHAGAREPGVGEIEYHPMTMPEVLRWFQFLSARLRHVRVVNGDWTRVLTGGAAKTLSVRSGKGATLVSSLTLLTAQKPTALWDSTTTSQARLPTTSELGVSRTVGTRSIVLSLQATTQSTLSWRSTDGLVSSGSGMGSSREEWQRPRGDRDNRSVSDYG